MTGGTVIVLGNTGRNFAAGMSGGIAYVYDPEGRFADSCNLTSVDLEPVVPASAQNVAEPRHCGMADEDILRKYIQNHAEFTGSKRAKQILKDWSESLKSFVKVFPKEYRHALVLQSNSKESV